MKFLATFTFIAVFALVAADNINTQTHHLRLGERKSGDRHLARARINADPAWLFTKSEDYSFDQKDVLNPANITLVSVYDASDFWKGGYATLTSGGPGFDFVKLHITSQWRGGYNFVIDIYGI